MKYYDAMTTSDEYDLPSSTINSSTRLAAIINGKNLIHKASKIVKADNTGMQRLIIP